MSQNPFAQKVKIYTRSAVCLTVVAILLRTLNFLFIFDPYVGYFDTSPLHIAYRVLCTLTVLWLLTALIFIPRYSFPASLKPASNNGTRIASVFCAVLIAGSMLFFYENMLYYTTHTLLYSLILLLALPSTVYFIFRYIGNKPDEHTVLSEYVLILWLGIILSVTYLNIFVPMNSPFKLTLHMALLALMLHLIEEARILTGHGFRIAYYAYTLIAILNTGLASIPVIVAYIAGAHQNIDYLFFGILSLGFFLFLCTRAHAFHHVLMTAPQPTPEEIEAAEQKKKREKEEKKKEKEEKKQAGKSPKKRPPETDKKEGDDNHVR